MGAFQEVSDMMQIFMCHLLELRQSVLENLYNEVFSLVG